MDINKAMSLCFRKEIKVYPIKDGKDWFIEFSVGTAKPTRFPKKLNKKDVNNAISKTYIFLAKKIEEK